VNTSDVICFTSGAMEFVCKGVVYANGNLATSCSGKIRSVWIVVTSRGFAVCVLVHSWWLRLGFFCVGSARNWFVFLVQVEVHAGSDLNAF